jgi:hypothetical protein
MYPAPPVTRTLMIFFLKTLLYYWGLK